MRKRKKFLNKRRIFHSFSKWGVCCLYIDLFTYINMQRYIIIFRRGCYVKKIIFSFYFMASRNLMMSCLYFSPHTLLTFSLFNKRPWYLIIKFLCKTQIFLFCLNDGEEDAQLIFLSSSSLILISLLFYVQNLFFLSFVPTAMFMMM